MFEDQKISYFGETNHRNQRLRFGIKSKDRRQHYYIIGKSGTGKTALLNNLAVQDIVGGRGCCVVDPHGEFVEGLLSQVPRERIDDVVYINPADTAYHTGFNILEVEDPNEKHLIASGLMGIFTKIWANVWSSRMEYILNNCVLALLDTPGSTLLGIPRLLVDKNYRQRIISNVKDPVVLTFWVNEYENWQDKFRSEAIAPIQNKVGQFLSTAIVRNIVGQKKSTINIFNMMNEGKIILLNVSKGRVGEDNSDLLGSMFITKIQLSAMERVKIPEDQRRDFYLYVDEFQNFATDSFADILSEARKYRLNLTMAHQYIGQLSIQGNTNVRDAVFGNVGTMVIFRVGAEDSVFLEQELAPEFMAHDMVNLPNYKIYTRLMIDGVTSRPFSADTLPPLKVDVPVCTEAEIINASRKRYCRSREEVEREINEWSGMAPSGGPASDTDIATAILGGPEGIVRPPSATPGASAPTPGRGEFGKIIPGLASLGIEFNPKAVAGTSLAAAPVPPKEEPLTQRLMRAQTQYDSIKEIKKKIQKAGSQSDLASALRLEEEPVKPKVPEAAKPILLKKLEEKGESNLSELQKTIMNVLEKDALKKAAQAPSAETVSAHPSASPTKVSPPPLHAPIQRSAPPPAPSKYPLPPAVRSLPPKQNPGAPLNLSGTRQNSVVPPMPPRPSVPPPASQPPVSPSSRPPVPHMSHRPPAQPNAVLPRNVSNPSSPASGGSVSGQSAPRPLDTKAPLPPNPSPSSVPFRPTPMAQKVPPGIPEQNRPNIGYSASGLGSSPQKVTPPRAAPSLPSRPATQSAPQEVIPEMPEAELRKTVQVTPEETRKRFSAQVPDDSRQNTKRTQ